VTSMNRAQRRAAKEAPLPEPDEALDAATTTLAYAEHNPFRLAEENARLRSAVQNAYSILRVFVTEAGGRSEVGIGALTDPGVLSVDIEGDIIVLTVKP
jgi:hypothetical protein